MTRNLASTEPGPSASSLCDDARSSPATERAPRSASAVTANSTGAVPPEHDTVRALCETGSATSPVQPTTPRAAAAATPNRMLLMRSPVERPPRPTEKCQLLPRQPEASTPSPGDYD